MRAFISTDQPVRPADMAMGERIDERRKAVGIRSQAELARLSGVPQQTLNGLINNPYRWSPHLPKIARALKTTVEYLSGDTDDPNLGAVLAATPEQVAEQLDLVSIASIDLAYGMGGTFADAPFEQEMLHFPRKWIESITTTPPAMLTFVRGRGDSMAPTIHDEDMVLVDRSQRRPLEQDAIWALTVGDIGMIKRLRLRGSGVTILSDNPQVPLDEAAGDEVTIVGRVIAIIKTL